MATMCQKGKFYTKLVKMPTLLKINCTEIMKISHDSEYVAEYKESARNMVMISTDKITSI
jgi:hypothetical protein